MGLGVLREMFPEVPIVCTTATATAITIAETARVLKLDRHFILLRGPVDRSNIKLTVMDKAALGEKGVYGKIWDLLNWEYQEGSGIIYCHSRKLTPSLPPLLLPSPHFPISSFPSSTSSYSFSAPPPPPIPPTKFIPSHLFY